MDTSVKSELINTERWNPIITHNEISRILAITDANERIAAASLLYFNKLQSVRLEDDQPQVVICTLPKLIEEHCGISRKTRGAKIPKFTELEKRVASLKDLNQSFLTDWGISESDLLSTEPDKDYDLHNSMKGRAMATGIPIQILRESSTRAFLDYKEKRQGQNQATFAWNFSMGLYYKANGRPWRLAKLMPGTCYIGISFYRNVRNPNQSIESSMAQLFTHSGEGFVLRGSDVIVDERTREPHLSEIQSENLLRDVLKKYVAKTGTSPTRVVIHKTSEFCSAETSGFGRVLEGMRRDFVSIRRSTALRVVRGGDYPVLRGTVIQLTSREYLLFTGGYIPRLRTYPGHKVPEPLQIMHDGDSDAETICREILGLTKLNWNTTSFSTNRPITLEFASRVGAILSELQEEKPTQDHYRFYM